MTEAEKLRAKNKRLCKWRKRDRANIKYLTGIIASLTERLMPETMRGYDKQMKNIMEERYD